MSQPGTTQNPLRVAIIGSGPAGFYAAQHLLKEKDLIVQVDMFDALPNAELLRPIVKELLPVRHQAIALDGRAQLVPLPLARALDLQRRGGDALYRGDGLPSPSPR